MLYFDWKNASDESKRLEALIQLVDTTQRSAEMSGSDDTLYLDRLRAVHSRAGAFKAAVDELLRYLRADPDSGPVYEDDDRPLRAGAPVNIVPDETSFIGYRPI